MHDAFKRLYKQPNKIGGIAGNAPQKLLARLVQIVSDMHYYTGNVK